MLVVTQRLLEGGCLKGSVSSQLQVSCCPCGIGGLASVHQVMGDVRGVQRGVVRVYPLQSIGHPKVNPLATGR